MADLDVTELLVDPDFVEMVTVTRRDEVVSAVTGRGTLVSTVFPNIVAFLITTDDDANVRKDDAQSTSRVINVVTEFRLRAAGAGIQPDVITYDGANYTVKALKPHTRWGAGFLKATAESMNAYDAPPV